jgi:hypothetical protein
MTIIITPSTGRMIRELEPVIPEMFEPAVRGTGRRYLETLRSREAATGAVAHATDGLAQQLADATRSVVRRLLVHQTATPMPLRTISHLLARDDVGEFNARSPVEQARVSVPRHRTARPYSFCALRADTGGTA